MGPKLLAVNEMTPYFLAAGHVHYARYGLLYLRSMQELHGGVLEGYLKGEHVQCHRQGLWNGIWTDMFNRSHIYAYGHGPGGLLGITLNEKTVHRCAMSLKLAGQRDSMNPSIRKFVQWKSAKKKSTVTAEQFDSGLILARALALVNS